MADIVSTGARAIANRVTGAGERGAVGAGERGLGRMRPTAMMPDGVTARLDSIDAARGNALKAMGKGAEPVHRAQLELAHTALFHAGAARRTGGPDAITEARKLLTEARGAAEMSIRSGGTITPRPATMALAQRALQDIDSAIARLGRSR